VRIFQLAKELNVESQEIMDALDDMGVEHVRSNLAALDDELVKELRLLFKPKPSTAKASKEEAVKRALAEREAREKAAEEAARREDERKQAARRAALERAAARRDELRRESEQAKKSRQEQQRTAQDEAATEPPRREEPTPAEPPKAPPQTQEPAARIEQQPTPQSTEAEEHPIVAEHIEDPEVAATAGETGGESAEGEAAATEEEPRPEAPEQAEDEQAPTGPEAADADKPAGLGKAVVAPPPTTAKERAEMLGKPLSEARQRPAGRRRPAPQPSAPAAPPRGAPPRPGAPGGAPGGAPPKKRSKRQAARKKAAEEQAAAERQQQEAAQKAGADDQPVGQVKVSDGITVKDLAERMGRKAKDLIQRLFMEKKILATINHALDEETAKWVVETFGGTPVVIGVEEEAAAPAAEAPAEEEQAEAAASAGSHPRAPVVTMMGHVDHGKTSLLDVIRKTRIAEREAGGITQHIGAYKIHEPTTRSKELTGDIVFLDTPGHEAFTSMRSRGAKITDIVVLVVAADDGVMPQTLEAINHARAAGDPLIVAVNKIDKPGANPDRVLQQLAEREVLVEEFGGDVVAVRVSAKTMEGIGDLLEMIQLVAEVQELKADPERPASGTVLEAKLDKSRGPIATVLVQNGTLQVGDVFVVGSSTGRVRALVDEQQQRLDSAGPSTPVVVMGLSDVPQAGDTLQVFADEQKARQIALYRQEKVREEEQARRSAAPTLERLHAMIAEGEVNELPMVVKADVQGSAEVLVHAVEKLSTSEVQVRVIHAGTGAITENDILLASASGAIVVGFNVRPERGVLDVAEREGVDVRLHTVIYKVTEEIEQAMLATLSPVEKEVYLGRAQVRDTFKVPKIGTVAGCYVVDGEVRRDARVRLLRDNVVVHEGRIASLKRFKDDAKQVRQGFECGIGLERFQDIKLGDEIEAFAIVTSKRDSLETDRARS
jgi:translation initiation factor IF-2